MITYVITGNTMDNIETRVNEHASITESGFSLFMREKGIIVEKNNSSNTNIDCIHTTSNTFFDVKDMEKTNYNGEECYAIENKYIENYQNICNKYAMVENFSCILAFAEKKYTNENYNFQKVNFFDCQDDYYSYFYIKNMKNIDGLKKYIVHKESKMAFYRNYKENGHVSLLNLIIHEKGYKQKADNFIINEKKYRYIEFNDTIVFLHNQSKAAENSKFKPRLNIDNCLCISEEKHEDITQFWLNNKDKKVYIAFYTNDEKNRLLKEFTFCSLNEININFNKENPSVYKKQHNNINLLNLCKDDYLNEYDFFNIIMRGDKYGN